LGFPLLLQTRFPIKMTKTTFAILLFVSTALSFAPQPSLAESGDSNLADGSSEPQKHINGENNEKVYWEFTGLKDFPYYPEEFQYHGGLNSMEQVIKNMEAQGIHIGHYISDDFVVGGVNLAQYEAAHPPFLLYEDFDIGSYLLDGTNENRWGWKDLLKIRNELERPSLSWYVDKVARKRWFAEKKDYPQPEVYYLHYKDELSETGLKEDERETILANLPTQHGFCAKPTHQSMTLGNWLVDIEPGRNENAAGARFTKQAKRLTASDPNGNHFDLRECADSLAEGLQREAMPIESWALRNVRPGIVVEELFSNHEDKSLPPHEFCMFVVWGKFYVGQWNEVGEDRYLDGFFYGDGNAAPGCPINELPDWVPWKELVSIAESLSEHKDMFRVDMFVGVPRYGKEGGDAELKIVVSESEIHPTTLFCNPFIAEDMARLWVAGYKIGNYETIPNDEVPHDYFNKQTLEAEATRRTAKTKIPPTPTSVLIEGDRVP
jgi:hypothetical protein